MPLPPSSTDEDGALALELRPLDEVLPALTARTLITKLAERQPGVDYARLVRRVCADAEANPIAIAEALDLATDRAWRDWEPETLREYCGLGGDDVQQLDKVMATQVAVTNSDIFDDWKLFNHVSTAFNHRRANFEWLDPASYLEAAWTCSALRALNTRHAFQPGVERYLTAICFEMGLLFFPWTGGDGLVVADLPWSKGLLEPWAGALGHELQEIWSRGVLSELAPSEVDDNIPLHVQMAKLVNAQAYIRSQRPRKPEAYA
jgi:hypothetical protein